MRAPMARGDAVLDRLPKATLGSPPSTYAALPMRPRAHAVTNAGTIAPWNVRAPPGLAHARVIPLCRRAVFCMPSACLARHNLCSARHGITLRSHDARSSGSPISRSDAQSVFQREQEETMKAVTFIAGSIAAALAALPVAAQQPTAPAGNLEKLGQFKVTGTPADMPEVPQGGTKAAAIKKTLTRIKLPRGFHIGL
jgi:hypothetical protein